jgi:hypothetical protein
MERFLTVDELNSGIDALATEFPEIASVRRVGTSRLGEPLHMLSIGGGPRNALVFAFPHPNEPIGGMTVHYLGRLLCEDAALRDELGFSWHLIPCIDPDGTRLNEGWFGGPFTRRHYARHFFRPAPDQQVEWTFPLAYKQAYFDRTLRETEALMRVIDELRPELMYSLHNAEHGGVYYYVSREAPELYATLQQLPAWEGLPLHLGEPEQPMIRPVAEGIYIMPSQHEMIDFIEAHGGDPAKSSMGASSDSWAARHGAFTLIVEEPYWDDPRANDLSPSAVIRRDALLESAEALRDALAFFQESYAAVERDLTADSPYRRTIEATLRDSADMLQQLTHWARTSDETARPATVAELFSSQDLAHMLRLRTGGQYLRLLEGEIGIGNGTPAIRSRLASAQERFDAWCNEADAAAQGAVIPIRKLVAVQVGAALATAEWLRG